MFFFDSELEEQIVFEFGFLINGEAYYHSGNIYVHKKDKN